MPRWALVPVAVIAGLAAAGAALAQDTIPARKLFSTRSEPAPMAPRAIGGYAHGCLAGGTALPIDGPHWQVMRLSRNRNWGHPILVDYMQRFATDVARDGWPGLLVGDLAQPRGGPMLTGHASHQVGLDADIWLLPMPNRTLSPTEREEISAISMLKPGTREINDAVWTDAHARMIRRSASYPEVARVFVHPAIKNRLCQMTWPDRDWLRKVRPWYGHDDHIHVRLSCPAGQSGCENQAAPPAGDGCGDALAWWLGPEPWKPKPPPDPNKPPAEMMMSALPNACRTVLSFGVPAEDVPLPRPRPDSL